MELQGNAELQGQHYCMMVPASNGIMHTASETVSNDGVRVGHGFMKSFTVDLDTSYWYLLASGSTTIGPKLVLRSYEWLFTLPGDAMNWGQ